MGFQECVDGIQQMWDDIKNQAVDGGYSQAYIDEIDVQVKANVITAQEALDKVNAVYIGQSAASIGYATKADLDADLTPADGVLAVVTNDTTATNNGTYRKSGATGTGSWVQSSYDRVALVEGSVKSIEKEMGSKVTLLVGVNKFDKTKTTDGYYVNDNSNGDLVANSDYSSSDLIKIDPNTLYQISGAESRFGSFFDENLNWVSGGYRNVLTSSITSPVTAKYFRYSIANTQAAKDVSMLTIETVPLEYVPYKVHLDNDVIPDVYEAIDKNYAATLENDFVDPDFQLTRPIITDTTTDQYLYQEFASKFTINPDRDSFNNFGKIVSISTALKEVDFMFSSEFLLNELNYAIGDFAQIGFYIKFKDATVSNTRRIYTGSDLSGYDTVKTVDNAEWVWVEAKTPLTINSDKWQGIYFGIRDAVVGEEIYVRGLTLTNITTDKWYGERKSTAIEKANKSIGINLNPYCEFIPAPTGFNGDIQQFQETEEQNGNGFVKSVGNVDFPIKGNSLKFNSTTDATQFRLNLYTAIMENGTDTTKDKILINSDFKDKYLKYVLYIKVTADATDFSVTQYQFLTADGFSGTMHFEPNKWVKVTTQPIKISDRASLDAIDHRIQINCTPSSGTVQIEVCGLTQSLSDTKYNNEIVLKNRASSSIFYKKIYSSYGDSITAQGEYQEVISALQGVKSVVAGIGGTTVANLNDSIAWVDANGNYLGRPPQDPPAGTEGVDYFEISSAMCTQQRVDTLPQDASLVTIMGGANDMFQNTIIGSIEDATNDTTTNPTFYAAYKSMLDKVGLRCPNARIVILNITSLESGDGFAVNNNGNTVEDFREAIRKVARYYGYPVIEPIEIGITAQNQTTYTIDGTHPTEPYHKLIGLQASKYISTLDYDEIKGV